MKLFGSQSNIQPQPNPKPMKVQRISHEVRKDGAVVGREEIIVKNVKVFPYELLRR